MKFLTENKKYLGLILIAAIAFNFAFLPLTASAISLNPLDWLGETVGWISGKTLLFISSTISALLGVLFGVVLWLEAQIIDYIISPANFSFTNSPIVTLGWGITRDLANMFFILILLAIAFATVLKIQSYAMKQLWWKVLAAAILINFSLVIAGFVIDFTQVLTAFFLKQITGGGSFGTITTRLASSMQILNFYNPARPEGAIGGITQFGGSAIAAVVGIILTLVGLVITVFVFGAAAIFLIVRILYIWFLLIIAPIVWIFWIIPVTSRYFSQWWDEFIKWTFFAPIYVFMIYLSLSIFDATGKFKTGVFPTGNADWVKATPGLTTIGMPQAIFQWILVIAMMFGSLIVAQKFGVEGATGARKILTGWGTDTKNWAGRYARRKATGWAQPLTEAEKAAAPPQGFRGRIGAAWRKTGAVLGGAAAVVPGVRGAYLGMRASTQKDYEAAYNNYKNVDPAILEQIEKSPILEARNRLALQQILMEKKKFKPNAKQLMPILDQAKRYNKEEDFLKIVADKMGDSLIEANGYNTGQREELIRRAKNNNIDKEFSKLLPDIAARVLKKPEETIEYKIKDIVSKIDKATDILEDQLSSEVVKAFSSDQLKSLAKSPNVGKRTKVANAIMSDFRALPQQKHDDVVSVLAIPDKNKRETARNDLSNDLKALSRKVEIVTAPGFEL
ncbi:MAG: hypothetical protein NTV77_03720 [Candidatus Azambacteria bacterium]|nr:hypothetical protein [Candidatus Azambacteria bacterium]